MMLFGFGRVPGCLGLGLFFLWDGWQSVRSVFWGCEGVVVCREGIGEWGLVWIYCSVFV